MPVAGKSSYRFPIGWVDGGGSFFLPGTTSAIHPTYTLFNQKVFSCISYISLRKQVLHISHDD
jgi:hypothetical protein